VKGTHYRIAKAFLHQLAADVELATPASEGWSVQVDDYSDESGRVYP
jgi:hypothetical protein